MLRYVGILFLFLFSLSFPFAFGEVIEITTDKSVYYDGETMHVSGTVFTELAVTSVNVVIFDPGRSVPVTIAPSIADSNGNFLVSIRIGGPLWSSFGDYFVQATSETTSKEITIEYADSFTSESTPEPESTPDPTPEPEVTLEPKLIFKTLKFKIPNFPSFDKSPQYYIDRYNSEPTYKEWFDSNFPINSIVDVVGYSSTQLDGFPSFDKSPQYYIDRYNSEPTYKEWFDSNFPNTSIYNILGYADPVSVPDWVRNNAEWWATGVIPDSAFVTGIEFMLENNIIQISNISSSESASDDEIPQWIRNNAHWWSKDLISEDEFVNSLKFLIQEGIIKIN